MSVPAAPSCYDRDSKHHWIVNWCLVIGGWSSALARVYVPIWPRIAPKPFFNCDASTGFFLVSCHGIAARHVAPHSKPWPGWSRLTSREAGLDARRFEDSLE